MSNLPPMSPSSFVPYTSNSNQQHQSNQIQQQNQQQNNNASNYNQSNSSSSQNPLYAQQSNTQQPSQQQPHPLYGFQSPPSKSTQIQMNQQQNSPSFSPLYSPSFVPQSPQQPNNGLFQSPMQSSASSNQNNQMPSSQDMNTTTTPSRARLLSMTTSQSTAQRERSRSRLGKEALERAQPGIAERWFGINKVKPPSTDHVKKDDRNYNLPLSIKLGQYELNCDPLTGNWILKGDSQAEAYINQKTQIQQLEQQLQQYTSGQPPQQQQQQQQSLQQQQQQSNQQSQQAIFERDQRISEMEKQNYTVLQENDRLKFKNKVLLAMCAISEGDYKALCREANIDPNGKPV